MSNQFQNLTNNVNNDLFNILKLNKLSPTSRNHLIRIHSDSDLNNFLVNNPHLMQNNDILGIFFNYFKLIKIIIFFNY